MSSSILAPSGIELPGIPETSVNIYTPKKTLSTKVVSKRRINDYSSPNYAWHIELNVEGTEMEARYRIGQSIGVIPDERFCNPELNLFHRDLNDNVRLYSIASPSWGDGVDSGSLSICVKREISEDRETGELVFGAASNYICDAKPGDELQITGPVGKSFLLPDDPLEHSYVFVATGTGVAPYRGMLAELFSQGIERDVWLIFGVPYSTDIMYEESLRELDEKFSNFRFVTCISREEKNSRGGKRYVQDALEENESELVPLLEDPSSMFYMCGLKGMDRNIYQWLARNQSDLITLPEGIDSEALQQLERSSEVWPAMARTRNMERLRKETY